MRADGGSGDDEEAVGETVDLRTWHVRSNGRSLLVDVFFINLVHVGSGKLQLVVLSHIYVYYIMGYTAELL